MALTFSRNKRSVHGDQKVWMGKVTFDSSYPTGGEAITPSDFNMSSDVDVVLVASNTGAEVVAWDDANDKLLVYTADGTEATNSSDQSSVEATVIAFGR